MPNGKGPAVMAGLFNYSSTLHIMHFTFLHPFKLKMTEEQPMTVIHEIPDASCGGGEFLDDAIRMDDVPFVRSEDCVAAGSPSGLL